MFATSASASANDSDFEEEEIIVFADFKNNILNELEAGDPLVKIIGIDSENPIAEINGSIFKGNYDFSMGTHVVFEEDENPPPIDPIFENYSKKTFKYLTKTNKVLNFSRIFVEKENKTEVTTEQETTEAPETDNTSPQKPLLVDKTYEEALQELKYTQN